MALLRNVILFAVGGAGYVGLECLWRGWSHISMFLAGGSCFLLLGKLVSGIRNPVVRGLTGSGIITAVELTVGLLANRKFQVWDYRDLPLNFRGQICLLYSIFWIPVSLMAVIVYKYLDAKL